MRRPLSSAPAKASQIAGLIIAGGNSSRFGTDKAIVPLHGESLLDLCVRRAAPQLGPLALNRDARSPDSRANMVLLQDQPRAGLGPLGGVLAGLEWARQLDHITHLASFAVDAPFFPPDYVARLFQQAKMQPDHIITASSGGRRHYLASLWPLSLAADLRQRLEQEGAIAVRAFIADQKSSEIAFDDQPFDPFFNINRPEQMAMAEKIYSLL